MINDEIIYRRARSRQINCENIESRGRNDVVSSGVDGGFRDGEVESRQSGQSRVHYTYA